MSENNGLTFSEKIKKLREELIQELHENSFKSEVQRMATTVIVLGINEYLKDDEERMQFGLAFEALKQGRHVKRQNWDNHLYLVDGFIHISNDNMVLVWDSSSEDLLAEDWQIVE